MSINAHSAKVEAAGGSMLRFFLKKFTKPLFTKLKGRRSTENHRAQYHDLCQTLMLMQLHLYTSFSRCYLFFFNDNLYRNKFYVQ